MKTVDGVGAMLWLFVVGLLVTTWPRVPEAPLSRLAEEAVEDVRVSWGTMGVFSSGCTGGISITGRSNIGLTGVSADSVFTHSIVVVAEL